MSLSKSLGPFQRLLQNRRLRRILTLDTRDGISVTETEMEEQTPLEAEVMEDGGELVGEPFYMELGMHCPTVTGQLCHWRMQHWNRSRLEVAS